jgi:hypothetical protein
MSLKLAVSHGPQQSEVEQRIVVISDSDYKSTHSPHVFSERFPTWFSRCIISQRRAKGIKWGTLERGR